MFVVFVLIRFFQCASVKRLLNIAHIARQSPGVLFSGDEAMKHYIIVKFKEEFDYKPEINSITAFFEKALDIAGVLSVSIKPSNSEKSNRYDLMIEMELEAGGLNTFDRSDVHAEWKDRYGGVILNKVIFDCE